MLGAVAGGLYGWSRERVSHGVAVILLNPLDGNPFSTSGRGDSLTNLETEAQLVRSFEVAELVRADTGTSTSAGELIASLDVVPPTNTQLLQISYSDSDPGRAVELAQSFAEQFLAFREQRSRAVVEDQLDLIKKQIAERQDEQNKLSRELSKEEGAGQAAVLQAQLDAITTQINQLRTRSAEIEIGPFSPGQVVTPAALRREGLLDSWVAYAAIGMLAGLVLSVLIAYVRSRMDTRIHHVDDVLLTGRTLLGEVALADVRSVRRRLSGPGPLEVPQAFRDLAVVVLTSEPRRPAVVLLAQGSADALRGPLSAGGLAAALATAGLRTTVVDTRAAWSVPVNARTGRPGLREVLASGGEPGKALIEIAENLQLLPAASPGDGADLLMSPAMGRLLERLRQVSDIVLLTSVGIRSSTTLALSNLADSLITEVLQGQSHATDASVPTNLPARDLGVVVITGGQDLGRRTQSRRAVGGSATPLRLPEPPKPNDDEAGDRPESIGLDEADGARKQATQPDAVAASQDTVGSRSRQTSRTQRGRARTSPASPGETEPLEPGRDALDRLSGQTDPVAREDAPSAEPGSAPRTQQGRRRTSPASPAETLPELGTDLAEPSVPVSAGG